MSHNLTRNKEKHQIKNKFKLVSINHQVVQPVYGHLKETSSGHCRQVNLQEKFNNKHFQTFQEGINIGDRN